ncbi:RNase H domain-containing protein [Abeliophyllum distichum]|uniref:RNase H domain-containing protein n=1 Tax=Abeliophyllum distichum TaxID=126358 RepID=A0ABD1Q433_9LAMI
MDVSRGTLTLQQVEVSLGTVMGVLLAYYKFYSHCSCLEAEIRALCFGLKLCNYLGFSRIWVEADSLATIQLIEKDKWGPWQIRYLLEEIQPWQKLMEIKFSHIWREGNALADGLGKSGYKGRAS